MWARVKFALDSKVENKPVMVFKEPDIVETELKRGTVRDKYKVFWSDKEETPRDLELRGNPIVDIEKVMKFSGDAPIAGYYDATILNYANSEDELLKLLETPQSRRNVKPTITIEPDKSNSKEEKKKHMHNAKEAQEYNSEKFNIMGQKTIQIDATANTYSQSDVKPPKRRSVVNNEPRKSDRSRTKPSQKQRDKLPMSEEEEDSDMDDVPYLVHEEKLRRIEELEKQLENHEQVLQDLAETKEKLHTAHQDIKESNKKIARLLSEPKEVRNLNAFWQKEEIARRSGREKSESRRQYTQHGEKPRHGSSASASKYGRDTSRDSRERHSAFAKTREELNVRTHKAASIDEDEKLEDGKLDNGMLDGETLDGGIQDDEMLDDDRNLGLQKQESRKLDTEKANDKNKHGSFSFFDDNTPFIPARISNAPVQVMNTNSDKGEVQTTGKTKSEVTAAAKADVVKSAISRDEEGGNSSKFPKGMSTQNNLQETDNLPSDEVAFGIIVDGVSPITNAQFNTCRTQGMKNKRGALGDPQFIKNLATCLWEPATLMARSGAGKAASTSTKAPRPECSPQKRKYCSELLKARIELEEKNCAEKEVQERTSDTKVKKYLGQKIKPMRRQAGMKEDE